MSCGICRRAVDGQHLCPRHAGDIREWLTELPQQVRLLREFLIPAAAPARSRIGGTGRAHSPVPVDLRVLTLIGPGHVDTRSPDDDGTIPVLDWLGGWAGYIAYQHPAVTRDPHGTAHVQPCDGARPGRRRTATVTTWCTWLTRYLPYTLTQPCAADLHHQLAALIHRLRDLTHTTPHRHPQAAPCPRCDIFALVAVDGQWHLTCDACGHRLDPDTYHQHATAYLHAHQATTRTHDAA